MNLSSAIIFFAILATAFGKDCPNKKSNSKLFCYYGKLTDVDSCKCSHIVLPANSDVKSIDRLREHVKGVKILITVNEFNQGLVDILKSSKVDGVEINLKKLDSKNDINDFISTVRSKLGADLYIVLSVPSKAEILAKYYDFKALSKSTDLFILQTAFLGASNNVTFHPSRLSGLWDMQNTDSVVDLVSGLGAPLSKLVIASPVQAFKFKLQSEKHTAPGSPALELESITRDELCRIMENKSLNWTLERDQDQAGPYIFSKDQWIAFDDAMSIDIKAKYARVRGLAGIALKDLSQDGGVKCESSILEAAYNGLSRQARAPRGAVLHSLEREILETPARPLDTVQVSPYRISRVIDVEGNVHVVRQDTRTEFECSRQGYFVHPRSCGRFYRCVKFDQLSDEFSVFEFDCPAGLAFDSRVEVCVWPGSLPHASPCSGSSEIAPVPRERFICPHEPGYYADPENCRWFFACLDHGKSPLSAYEFRCPFGLVYDESRLLCEWPWLVPKCGSGLAVGSEVVYGGSGLVALDQYDGLGVLGATRLGGLHGPLQQPVAKVYSNVGATGLGVQGINIVQDNNLIHGNVGYESGAAGLGLGVSQGAVYGAANSGLSYNSLQSLQNAGLLKTGAFVSGLGYNVANSGNLNYAQYAANAGYGSNNIDTGFAYTKGQNAYQGSGYGMKSTQSFTQYHGTGADSAYTGGSHYTANAASQGNFQQNYISHGVDNLNYDLGSAGKSTAASAGQVYLENAHLVNGLAYDNNIAAIGAEGAKSQQSFTQYVGHGQTGYDATKSTIQYHGNTGSTYESGVAGNINIVGGGYSAVGVSGHGIEVSNNGENTNTVIDVTPSPIAVTTVSSVPTVTAVPVPALKVASGFESYRGGVVANIPELQYKIQKQPVSNVFYQTNLNAGVDIAASRGHLGVANISTDYVNVVSSTPATVEVHSGYDYPKPAIAFVEEPIKTTSFVQQPVVISTTQAPVVVKKINLQPAVVSTYNVQQQSEGIGGYNYPKPAIKFEETPVQPIGGSFSYQKYDTVHKEIPLQSVSYSTPSTPRPVTFVQQVQPVVKVQPTQPAVSYSNFQGYDYPKPSIVFEEKPQVQVTSYNVPSTTIKPQIYVSSTPATVVQQKVVQPAVVSSFHISSQPQIHVQQQAAVSYNEGYHYPRPAVAFEEKPAVTYTYQAPVQVKPAVTTYTYKNVVQQGYSYPKPAISFEETPVVSTYNYVAPSTVKPAVIVQKQQPALVSYSYTAPSTVKPAVVVQKQPEILIQKQPAVVSSYSYTAPSTVKPAVQFTGYDYPKPAVQFVEAPTPVVTSYENRQPVQEIPFVKKTAYVTGGQSTSYQFNQQFNSGAAVQVEQKPLLVESYHAPVAVSTTPKYEVHQQYSNIDSGYVYEKPAIKFEERPVVVSTTPRYEIKQQYSNIDSGYVYQKPAIKFEERPVVVSTTPRYEIKQQYSNIDSGYVYQKPSIKFEERPVVVSTTPRYEIKQQYSNIDSGYVYQKPAIKFVERPVVVSTTPRYEIKQQYSNIDSGYVYQKPAIKFEERPVVVSTTPRYEIKQQYSNVDSGYVYQQPAIKFEERPVVVSTTPRYEIKQQYSNIDSGYVYQKPAIKFEERPVVISTTPRYEIKQQYSADSGYVYDKPSIQFEEKPVVVENYNLHKIVSTTATPIVDYNYVQSTPRPTFASVINNVVAAKVQPLQQKQEFYFYDSRLSSTPRPVVQSYSTPISTVETVTTSRPIAKYSFSSLDDQYQFVSAPLPTKDVVVEEYAAPIEVTTPQREYLPVRNRVKVTTEEYVAPIEVTTPQHEYLPVRNRVRITTAAPIEVTTPQREYLPVRNRVKVTTEEYVAPIEVITPQHEYLPVRNRVKVTTEAPSREYLPVRSKVKLTSTTALPDEDEIVISTRRPTKVVKVVRPKTIVKVNDFHPLLSAKLGAQCTCKSNTVRLRKKKPLRIVVEENDDDDDDDGYIVEQNNGADVVVENYEYEPKKLVEITPTPEIYIKSTTNAIEPAPTPFYTIKKRVRVRPVTSTTLAYESPVTEVSELFLKKSPAVTFVRSTTEGPSDQEIVKAVKTGLKLVKQAAKEGAQEALNSKDFDRYGPGGVRSRNERLQGTIDCQRAGLFRHPTQCNKFYACRWDCTKNRYTLHVFNCPVHLTFDNNLGACNWPSQGPACLENTLLPSD